MKTTVSSRSAGSASSRMYTPFGIMRYSAGRQREAELRGHRRNGDARVDAVHQEAPEVQRRVHPAETPFACHVATIGIFPSESAATQIAGVIGSCRWMTSNCPRADTAHGPMALGERTMFGSEPFPGRPRIGRPGRSPSSGSLWRAAADAAGTFCAGRMRYHQELRIMTTPP